MQVWKSYISDIYVGCKYIILAKTWEPDKSSREVCVKVIIIVGVEIIEHCNIIQEVKRRPTKYGERHNFLFHKSPLVERNIERWSILFVNALYCIFLRMLAIHICPRHPIYGWPISTYCISYPTYKGYDPHSKKKYGWHVKRNIVDISKEIWLTYLHIFHILSHIQGVSPKFDKEYGKVSKWL